MTTNYNVTVELADVSAEEVDRLADELYGRPEVEGAGLAVHCVPGSRQAAVTVTLPGVHVSGAVATALDLVESTLNLEAYAVAALPTDEFDRRADRPEYISVPEAAERLSVSQQRVRQLLEEAKLAGTKVGRDWNVSVQSVQDRLARR